MVFTQGPRCGGAGSLRGPRRRRTLAAASEGHPEKEGLETEAQRASGSGPCRLRQEGPRRREGVWAGRSWGPSRPPLSAPHWAHHLSLSGAPQLGQHAPLSQPVWGADSSAASPPRMEGSGGGRCQQLAASPGDWGCQYQRTIGVCYWPPSPPPASVGRAGENWGLNCSQNHPSTSGQARPPLHPTHPEQSPPDALFPGLGGGGCPRAPLPSRQGEGLVLQVLSLTCLRSWVTPVLHA